MIINAAGLVKYLHSIAFPCLVYEDNSNQVAMYASRDDLLALINEKRIAGHGTRSRLRRLEMIEPFERPTTPRSRGGLPIAEDNRTTTIEQVSGGVLYQHHFARCFAYSRKQEIVA